MKRDIYHIDWTSESNIDPKLLKANSSWVLPQLTALFASFPLARNDSDQYSASLTLKRIASEIDSITFSNGMPITLDIINNMLKYVLHTKRSDILSGTQLVTPRYSAAVPFFLSAFKEHRNIQYSSWDTSDKYFNFLIEADWYDAFNNLDVPKFSKEQLLDFRAKARTVGSGDKAGTTRSINATTSIKRIGDSEFDSLPKYWKLALCQTWVFHPSNRHPLAITNPYNIDTVAEPLVSSEVLETKKPTKVEVDWDNMWSIVDAQG